MISLAKHGSPATGCQQHFALFCPGEPVWSWSLLGLRQGALRRYWQWSWHHYRIHYRFLSQYWRRQRATASFPMCGG